MIFIHNLCSLAGLRTQRAVWDAAPGKRRRRQSRPGQALAASARTAHLRIRTAHLWIRARPPAQPESLSSPARGSVPTATPPAHVSR
jgi:hypothetical protein